MFRWISLLLFPLAACVVLVDGAAPAPPAPLPVPPLTAVPTPADHVVWSLIDVQGRPVAERPYLRYLGLGHLPNAKAKQEMWQVVAGHVNGTSRDRLIWRPAVILASLKGGVLEVADGLEVKPEDWDRAVLVRLNFGYYGWKREVYETLSLVDPHFHFREKLVASIDLVKGLKTPSPPVLHANHPDASPVLVDGFLVPSFSEPPPNRREPTIIGGRRSYRVSWDGGRNWFSEGETPPGWPPRSVFGPPKRVAATAAVMAKPSVLKVPPHGAWLPAKEITQLALETVSDVPLVYADFFYWQTGIQSDRAPGPGYYDLIQVKNLEDFQRFVGFDPVLFKKLFKDYLVEYRAAVGRSGIAYQPRRIVVFDKPGGEFWITFDNRLALRERNPLETPGDDLVFDATEVYAHTSSGLWAFFLANAAGEAQAAAPDFIGHDSTTTSKLARIEVGLSCIRCHTNGGLQDFRDWYRNQFKPPVRIDSPDYKKIVDVQKLYFISIESKLEPGRRRYAAALKEATGLAPQEYAKTVRNRWYAYADAPTAVDVSRAARELGTTKERLQASLRGFKTESLRGYTVLDMFLRPETEQEPLGLEQWHEVVTEAHKALAGAKP